MKKNCKKFKRWLEKKDISFTFVFYESNMTSINNNTYWIGYGSTINVCNILQCINLRKSMKSEQCIYS